MKIIGIVGVAVEIKKILNEHKIKQIRIPTTDYKMHSPVVEEKKQQVEITSLAHNVVEEVNDVKIDFETTLPVVLAVCSVSCLTTFSKFN